MPVKNKDKIAYNQMLMVLDRIKRGKDSSVSTEEADMLYNTKGAKAFMIDSGMEAADSMAVRGFNQKRPANSYNTMDSYRGVKYSDMSTAFGTKNSGFAEATPDSILFSKNRPMENIDIPGYNSDHTALPHEMGHKLDYATGQITPQGYSDNRKRIENVLSKKDSEFNSWDLSADEIKADYTALVALRRAGVIDEERFKIVQDRLDKRAQEYYAVMVDPGYRDPKAWEQLKYGYRQEVLKKDNNGNK